MRISAKLDFFRPTNPFPKRDHNDLALGQCYLVEGSCRNTGRGRGARQRDLYSTYQAVTWVYRSICVSPSRDRSDSRADDGSWDLIRDYAACIVSSRARRRRPATTARQAQAVIVAARPTASSSESRRATRVRRQWEPQCHADQFQPGSDARFSVSPFIAKVFGERALTGPRKSLPTLGIVSCDVARVMLQRQRLGDRNAGKQRYPAGDSRYPARQTQSLMTGVNPFGQKKPRNSLIRLPAPGPASPGPPLIRS
jgi:hypothetical protein